MRRQQLPTSMITQESKSEIAKQHWVFNEELSLHFSLFISTTKMSGAVLFKRGYGPL